MFGKTKIWIVAAIVLLIAILAGCTSAQPTLTLEPTVDSQPTFALIQTQAVQTAVAQMTLNAPIATEVPPPTETPLPTATTAPTQTQVLPTLAPALPTTAPTATFVPWTATPAFTATSQAYNCTITEQSPAFGADIRVGGDFDGRWVIKNTGTQTWQADGFDIKYLSGQKFHTGPDVLDLGQDVVTQGTYTIVLDMLAPNSDGRYTTSWGLVRGNEVICALPITIDVIQ
jgi:hypothetical protein